MVLISIQSEVLPLPILPGISGARLVLLLPAIFFPMTPPVRVANVLVGHPPRGPRRFVMVIGTLGECWQLRPISLLIWTVNSSGTHRTPTILCMIYHYLLTLTVHSEAV